MNDEKTILKLAKYEKIAQNQLGRIRQLKIMLEEGIDARSEIENISRENEELFLGMKSISYEIRGDDPDSQIEEFGTTETFPSSLERIAPGIWKFTLPTFVSNPAKKRFANEGKHMFFVVLNLLREYEINNGRISYMKKPVLCFRHHICTETDRIFDFDNIDSKRAIDAMQGYFLKGDDALYLTIIQEAEKDPGKSFCEIFVFDRAETSFDFNRIIIKKQQEKQAEAAQNRG